MVRWLVFKFLTFFWCVCLYNDSFLFFFCYFCGVGSSNDIVEFSLNDNIRRVELRRGPKSYTYGCFIKVLEMFYEYNTPSHDIQEKEDALHDNDNNLNFVQHEEDDMEAFLNSCDDENENEEEMIFEMNLYGSDTGKIMASSGTDVGNGDNDDQEVLNDIKALTKLISAMKDARLQYSMNSDNLQTALNVVTESKERYSAILVHSEIQTLYLYELAAHLVRQKICHEIMEEGVTVEVPNDYHDGDVSNQLQDEIKDAVGEAAGETVIKYASELTETYFRIRH